jgi:hypothetical protein
MTLKVPPYLLDVGDVVGVVVVVVVEVVGLVVEVVGVVDVGGVVVTAGALVVGVAGVVEVPELQPTTMKAQISKTTIGIIALLKFPSSSFYFYAIF